MTENPYDILGVSPDASKDEVKKAYRKKARENHPDLNPGDEAAAARMNKINEAYDRIMNPEKYAREDARKNYGYGAPYAPGQGGYGGYGGTGAGGAGSSGAGQGSSGNPYQNPFGGPAGSPYGSPYGQPGQGGTYQWVEFNWDDIFGYGATPQSIHPEPSAADSPQIRQAISYINSSRYNEAVDILSNIASYHRDARWYYLSALANHGAGNTLTAHEQINRALKMDPQNPDYRAAQRVVSQTSTEYEAQGAGQGFTMNMCDPSQYLCCFCLAPMMCQPWMFCF